MTDVPSPFKAPLSGDLNQTDFENHLANFRREFLQFLEEVDPEFDLSTFQNPADFPPFPPTEPPVERLGEGIFARNKADLYQEILQPGPRVVEGGIFGEQVILGKDVRVKGNVFGCKGVEIGESCVIEGDLVSDRMVKVGRNCRVEGSIIGGEVELEGPLTVRALISSQGNLSSTGSIKAANLNAGGHILLRKNQPGEVSLETPLIFSRNGDIEIEQVVRLAGSLVDPARQKFYILWNNGQFQLSRSPFELSEGENSQGALLTVLTDMELEKMVADLAVFKVTFNLPVRENQE